MQISAAPSHKKSPKNAPTILLVDNGSSRAQATLQLRHIADALSVKTQQKIHPVSLQHADRINEAEVKHTLNGQAADTLHAFMAKALANGQRDFVLIPLFFGKSRALTSFVPDQVAQLEQEFGPINLTLAEVLYPLPDGNPLLVDILHQHATQLIDTNQDNASNKLTQALVLVDHGSPVPSVSAVRQHICSALTKQLPKPLTLEQAAMERRQGKQYDFNGQLLKDYLEQQAQAGVTHVGVLLLFLLPGIHAGKGGDIATICESVSAQYPQFSVSISPLIGESPRLLDYLAENVVKTLANIT